MTISSGVSLLDEALEGGIPQGQLTLLYGEAGGGKSGLMMQLASNTAKHGSKTLFIQTDSRFPSERFKQIAGSSWKEAVEHVPILELHEFREQEQIVERLPRYTTPNVKLILWDTFTSLYRVAQGASQQNVLLNKSLNRQLILLLELAREREVAIIIAAQMRGVIQGKENGSEQEWSGEGPVAENVLDYWTAVRLKLQKTPKPNQRRLTIERHPEIKTLRSIQLQMSEKGLEAAQGY